MTYGNHDKTHDNCVGRKRARGTLHTVPASIAIIIKRGGNSSIGRAPVCGTGCCGFKSRFPPQNLCLGLQ
jgi:hypothetical protein